MGIFGRRRKPGELAGEEEKKTETSLDEWMRKTVYKYGDPAHGKTVMMPPGVTVKAVDMSEKVTIDEDGHVFIDGEPADPRRIMAPNVVVTSPESQCSSRDKHPPHVWFEEGEEEEVRNAMGKIVVSYRHADYSLFCPGLDDSITEPRLMPRTIRSGDSEPLAVPEAPEKPDTMTEIVKKNRAKWPGLTCIHCGLTIRESIMLPVRDARTIPSWIHDNLSEPLDRGSAILQCAGAYEEEGIEASSYGDKTSLAGLTAEPDWDRFGVLGDETLNDGIRDIKQWVMSTGKGALTAYTRSKVTDDDD